MQLWYILIRIVAAHMVIRTAQALRYIYRISPSVNKFIDQRSIDFFLFKSSEILILYALYNIGAQVEDTWSSYIRGCCCVWLHWKLSSTAVLTVSSSLFIYKLHDMGRKNKHWIIEGLIEVISMICKNLRYLP